MMLDVVRAARFVSGIMGTNPVDTPITVIGGYSGAAIVPLLSQSSFGKDISGEAYNKVVNRILYDGDEVVKARDGAGSATLRWCQVHQLLTPGSGGREGCDYSNFHRSSRPLSNPFLNFTTTRLEDIIRMRLARYYETIPSSV